PDFPGLRLGHEVAEQGKTEKQQEADMHGPHDLAGQGTVGRRPELEQREAEGDPEGDTPAESVSKAGRQAFDRLFRRMRIRLALHCCKICHAFLELSLEKEIPAASFRRAAG